MENKRLTSVLVIGLMLLIFAVSGSYDNDFLSGKAIYENIRTLDEYLDMKAKKPLLGERKLSESEEKGAWTGLISGVVIDLGQVVGYYYLAINDHPEVLRIPVATNVISGSYELVRFSYRNARRNARQRLLERHTAKIL